jgi:signal transduction histidine kinase
MNEQKQRRIMVVEDERIIALDLAVTLEDLGYQVAGLSATGEDALARASALEPDLILMDIRLGGPLDGVETAARIRATVDVPVIFLTSHSDGQTLQRATGSAPYGYLLKPFRSPDLHCAIEVGIHKHAVDQKLRERERWLATTLRSITEGVVATDPDHHVTLLNPVAEALTGWTEQEALGRRIEEIVSLVDDAAPVLVDRNGGRHPATSTTAIVEDRGEVLGGVLVIHDAAAERGAAEQIQRLNADLETRVIERTRELELANRELEAFSYSVAHDLRAPLRGITGFSQALVEDHATGLGAEGQEHLQRVISAAQRMTQLIEDLLRLSSLARALTTSDVDFSKLATQTVERLRVDSPRDNVAVRIEPNMRLRADRQLIQIALENLLGNAWKFTSNRPSASIQIDSLEIDGQRGFVVRDDGDGFAPEGSERMFGAFQRLHPSSAFEGTGIGLAIVQRIVLRHGGRIWAESAPGCGATFSVLLGAEKSGTGHGG